MTFERTFLFAAESAYDQFRNIHDKKLDEAEEVESEQRQRNVTKKYVCRGVSMHS